MFIRYKMEKDREVPIAKVYSSREHTVRNSQIDKDALWAVRKLQSVGAEAYIVGGAVRDMLLGRKPKDFDIATSMSPRQVQKLFWNARIIGRRFKIVHLYFSHNKIIEVTTFRSDEENFEEGNNNIFGTIEQDAKRRDFSINSLYYNPANGQLLDFNDSLPDFKKRVIRSLIPLSYSFQEDPVRMLRAVKYSVTTGFTMKWDVRRSIKKNAKHLGQVSTSRLTEEVAKILTSGNSLDIFDQADKYKLLVYILPCMSVYLQYPEMRESLKDLDDEVRTLKENGTPIDRSELLYRIMKPIIVLDNAEGMSADERLREVFRQIKVNISPITPPNYEIEKASQEILKSMGFRVRDKKKQAQMKRKKPGQTLGRRASANEELGGKKVQSARKPQKARPEKKPQTLAESHDE